MKLLTLICVLTLSITYGFGQDSLYGKYQELTTANDNWMISRILSLQCDMSFTIADSSVICYGRWKLKNENEISLNYDSVKVRGYTSSVNEKLEYLIENNRLRRKSIPKKEYKDLIKGFKKSSETFEEFKLREGQKYFQQIEKIKCD